MCANMIDFYEKTDLIRVTIFVALTKPLNDTFNPADAAKHSPNYYKRQIL